MISLRRTVSQLERLEEFGRSAVTCYSQAIGSTDRHAIEFNADVVARFRSQLNVLKQQLKDADSPEQLQGVQSSFDAQVKGFQDRVREHLEQIQRELTAAAAAVEAFTGSFTESSSDLEAGVKRELKQLGKIAASEDINEIRDGIRTAVTKITASVEEMRSCNQLAVAQLKDEIRLLHQKIRGMQQSEEQNPARKHLNDHMDELVRRGRPFSVLLVVIKNLDGLQNCHGPKVLESGLDTFKARFESALPGSATVGRWSKDQFAAVLDIERATAIRMSGEVMAKLAHSFVESVDGVQHILAFHVTTGVIDYQPGSDPQKFQNKLTQLVSALAGRADG